MGIEALVRQTDQELHGTAGTMLVVEDDEVGREALVLALPNEGFTAEEAVRSRRPERQEGRKKGEQRVIRGSCQQGP